MLAEPGFGLHVGCIFAWLIFNLIQSPHHFLKMSTVQVSRFTVKAQSNTTARGRVDPSPDTHQFAFRHLCV